MTKAQAIAALTAMESAQLPGSAVLSFPGGVETWAIAMDTGHIYSGAQLEAIAAYADANGLTLSSTFSAFGLT